MSSDERDPRHDLLAALMAASQISRRIHLDRPGPPGDYRSRFDALLADARRVATAEADAPWASTGPLLGALLKLCGHMMNDEDAQISNASPFADERRFIVTNTKQHAQRFAFGETPEAAVRAYLESYTLPDRRAK